jgi:hypothetical protein
VDAATTLLLPTATTTMSILIAPDEDHRSCRSGDDDGRDMGEQDQMYFAFCIYPTLNDTSGKVSYSKTLHALNL